MAKKSAEKPLRLPSPSDRTFIVGRTGSGKTIGALWLLGRSDIDVRPWIILDYKNDEHINAIEKAQQITYKDLPKHPGVYILKVRPDDDELISDYLLRVHEEQGIGLFVDEAMMLGQHNLGLNTCLTQGRSMRIPMILCSQQPVNVSTWCFSEATYFMVFDLTRKSDRQKMAETIGVPVDYELPEHESYWYDVRAKKRWEFAPVPDETILLQAIDMKLPEQKRRRFL